MDSVVQKLAIRFLAVVAIGAMLSTLVYEFFA